MHSSIKNSGWAVVHTSPGVTNALSSPLISQTLFCFSGTSDISPSSTEQGDLASWTQQADSPCAGTSPELRDTHWPSLTGTGQVTLSMEPLRPTEPPSQISTCALSLGCVPVRALLGKNKGQLCSSTALQCGIRDVVVDQLGDALGVAVRLFHQCHVIACAWNTAEPHRRPSLTSPEPLRALRLTTRTGSWERGWRAEGS